MSQGRIAVIGTGTMGATVARALVARGHRVVVWNRTPSKAHVLEGSGVEVAASVQDAVADSSLVLVTVSSYAAAYTVLDGVDDWGAAAVVNLVTGSPRDASDFASWTVARSVPSLDGVIVGYPDDVTSGSALVLYGGSRGTWDAHRGLLLELSQNSQFLSQDPASASVLDVALLGAVYNPAFAGFIEAAAYVQTHGLPVSALVPGVSSMLEMLARDLPAVAEAVTSGTYETDQATVDVHVGAVRTWREAMRDAGLHATVVSAVVEVAERTRSAGHGHLGMHAQFMTAMRGRAPDAAGRPLA